MLAWPDENSFYLLASFLLFLLMSPCEQNFYVSEHFGKAVDTGLSSFLWVISTYFFESFSLAWGGG